MMLTAIFSSTTKTTGRYLYFKLQSISTDDELCASIEIIAVQVICNLSAYVVPFIMHGCSSTTFIQSSTFGVCAHDGVTPPLIVPTESVSGKGVLVNVRSDRRVLFPLITLAY